MFQMLVPRINGSRPAPGWGLPNWQDWALIRIVASIGVTAARVGEDHRLDRIVLEDGEKLEILRASDVARQPNLAAADLKIHRPCWKGTSPENAHEQRWTGGAENGPSQQHADG
jgi:hypothetical protein